MAEHGDGFWGFSDWIDDRLSSGNRPLDGFAPLSADYLWHATRAGPDPLGRSLHEYNLWWIVIKIGRAADRYQPSY